MTKRWSARYKMAVLEYAKGIGCNAKSYREFDVQHSTFYSWKKAFERDGAKGLIPKKPVAKSHPRQLAPEIVEKVIHLRKTYHFGPQRSLVSGSVSRS